MPPRTTASSSVSPYHLTEPTKKVGSIATSNTSTAQPVQSAPECAEEEEARRLCEQFPCLLQRQEGVRRGLRRGIRCDVADHGGLPDCVVTVEE